VPGNGAARLWHHRGRRSAAALRLPRAQPAAGLRPDEVGARPDQHEISFGGEEEGLKIRAEADERRTRIRSDAFKTAERRRGEGEAAAARIYARSLEKAPEFYRFSRPLEAARKFLQPDTTLVLPANSELFGLLYDSDHYRRAGSESSATGAPGGAEAAQEAAPTNRLFNQRRE
jgi:hypothetical protein